METCFDIIADTASFEAIRNEWNALVAASSVDHAFMRHEWFSCWLKYLGDPGKMCFIVAREGSELAAIAPMQIYSESLKGLPARVLGFAGSTITPRCNVATAPGFEVEKLYRYLLVMPGIDLVIARGMARDAQPTDRLCRYLEEKDIPNAVEIGRRSPYLITEGTWEDYFNGLSRSFRTILKRGEGKLEKAGTIRYQKIERHDELAPIMPDLVAVSARSWKAREKTDLKSLPHVVRFLDEFSRLGESSGLWEAWVLYLNEKPIAFDYYLRHNRRLSLIRTDFDLEYKELSPGNNLQSAILRDLFAREGVWEYDMGGQDYDYKLRWTEKIREHIDIWTAGKRPWGKLLLFGKRRLLPHLARTPEVSTTAGSDG